MSDLRDTLADIQTMYNPPPPAVATVTVTLPVDLALALEADLAAVANGPLTREIRATLAQTPSSFNVRQQDMRRGALCARRDRLYELRERLLDAFAGRTA